MGNRALIQVVGSRSEDVSPVLYLHWHGHKVPEYIEELKAMMADRPDDVQYTFARLVGICHTHIEPPLSMGVWSADKQLQRADSHGDHGVYIINCANWHVENLL
jgi:hypothetical protein